MVAAAAADTAGVSEIQPTLQKPLEDIRVVEVANYVAVPAAGRLLADLGADVIKIETPPAGELYRRGRLQYAGYETDFPENPPFQMDNAGKRSLVLDLKREEAREALAEIIRGAQVFITNLLPARRVKYGLDHETLMARDPRLVVGAISGYGLGGAESETPAFDYTAYWARTGMMDAVRDEGVAPSLQRPALGDHAAAVNLVCGIMAALRLRDANGVGQYVDVSLLQTGLHILGNDVSNALITREPLRRHDRRAPANPLWNSYRVKEDRWILLVMIDADRYWADFCRAIGKPELEGDERFCDGFARVRNGGSLVEILDAIFAENTLEEWERRFAGRGLIWSPVRSVADVADDPQARELGYFCEVEHPEYGPFEIVGPPFRIEGTDLAPRGPAPAIGADAEAVLIEAGLPPAAIRKLIEEPS